MVEFSLETPRAAAAAAAEAAAARADASPAAAAAAGAADNSEARPSGATVDGKGLKKTTKESLQARGAEANFSDGGASSSAKAAEVRVSVNDGQAARKSFLLSRNKKGATNQNVREEKRVVEAIASARGIGQQHTRSAAATAEAQADDEGCGAEWEGVTWDEDDVPEADSLGTVSASLVGTGSASVGSAGSVTLGTVELASRNGDTTLAGTTATDPTDMLICLKGVVGIGGVSSHHDTCHLQVDCFITDILVRRDPRVWNVIFSDGA